MAHPDDHVHLLKTVHDKLVERAKSLFPGDKYAELVRRVETRNISESTRDLIVQQRVDTDDMSGMNHDHQFRLLGRQLEIERFLNDWDHYCSRREGISGR